MIPGPERWDGSPDWKLVPESLRGGLQRYVEEQIKPGGFLTAVLENDLKGAVGNASPRANFEALPDLLVFLWNYAPALCWGSRANVHAWLTLPGPEDGLPGESGIAGKCLRCGQTASLLLGGICGDCGQALIDDEAARRAGA